MTNTRREPDPPPSLIQARTGRAIARAIRFAFDSSTLASEPADLAAIVRRHHPAIVALWHGQFMLVPMLCPLDIPVRIMVAKHDDAAILAEMLQSFGMGLIRGAGAGLKGRDRGGAQALRLALGALEDGYMVPMTADVPPGPARTCGLGIVTLARLSGRPILPFAIASSRYTSFDTWSRMTVNLPYARIGACLAEAIHVPRDVSAEELEVYRLRVEAALDGATAKAYALAGADPARATPARKLIAAGRAGPPAPGWALKAYVAATSALRPVAPLILDRRERQGKEEAQRRSERLGLASRPRPEGPLVWVHAASVGETNTVLPLIQALGQSRPDLAFLLTTGTVTSAGLAAARLPPPAIHQYVPLDAAAYVRRFLDHWRPGLALFAESEIWPNLVLETAARGTPLVLLNGRMSKDSFRKWRRRRAVAAPLFGRFALVLAQNARLAERFAELGAPRTLGVGNLKMDAPPPPVDEALRRQLEAAIGGRPLLLAASTHEGEETLIGQAHTLLRATQPDLLTIIAPRHPERGPRIAADLAGAGLAATLRSAGALPAPASDIYIADTIGELGTLFALAKVAFIGGSLIERGGQNPIEAVKLGAAVLTGPHTANFRDEYRELIRRRGAREVRSAAELASAAKELFADPELLISLRTRASTVVADLSGAMGRTLEALAPLLPSAAAPVAAPMPETAAAGRGLRHAW